MSTSGQATVKVTDMIPPQNVATVDLNGATGNTYTKEQLDSRIDERETIGYLGEKDPSTITQTGNYYFRAKSAGNYVVNSTTITVTSADISDNLEVQILVTDGVPRKKVISKPISDPTKLPLLSALTHPINAGVQFVDSGKIYLVTTQLTTGQTPTTNPEKVTSIGGNLNEYLKKELDYVISTQSSINESKTRNDSGVLGDATGYDVRYFPFTQDIYVTIAPSSLTRESKVFFTDANFTSNVVVYQSNIVLNTQNTRILIPKTASTKSVIAFNVLKTDTSFKVENFAEINIATPKKIDNDFIDTLSKIEDLTENESAITSKAVNDFIQGHFEKDSELISTEIRSFPLATAYTDYPMGIIQESTGTIVSTRNSSRRWSGLIDVSNYKFFSITWSGSTMQVAFYDANSLPILPVQTTVSSGTIYELPKNCKYIVHNVYAGGSELNYTTYSVKGYYYENPILRNDSFHTFIKDTIAKTSNVDEILKTNKYDLDFKNFVGKNIVDINSSFFTGTQQERIQQALDFAEGKYITLYLGKDTVNNSKIWNISSSLLIGSKTALLIGDGITIKFSQNNVVDNIIRSKNISTISGATLHSVDYMRGNLVTTQKLDNIVIRGIGIDSSFLEGSDTPYSAARPNESTGGAVEQWIGDNYGWRTISVLITNCENVEVGGFSLTKTKGWGVVFENVQNFYKHDIYIDSTNVKNGDGGDSILGSSNGLIKNIKGKTYDDLYCVGTIPRDRYITYPNYSRYIFPMYAGLNDFAGKPLSEQDVHDIDLIDIVGSSLTITVRVLATMGAKVYNIDLNNIKSVNNGYNPYSILSIETGYNIGGGAVAQIGDMYNINANNVSGTTTTDRTIVKCPLRNSWLNNIQKKSTSIGVEFSGYSKDSSVKTTNLY